jgi:MscS family membrane protein
MSMIIRKAIKNRFIAFTVLMVIGGLFTIQSAMAQHPAVKALTDTAKEEKTAEKPEKAKPKGPRDEHNRGTPRSSVEGFVAATRNGKYEKAAQYLDLRNLPIWIDANEGPELARKLKIIMDKAFWMDLELVSTDPNGAQNDGLPFNRDLLDRIKTPYKAVDILLQHVPRDDGVYIWKFSNRTVAEIPTLYNHFGYSPYEEKLRKLLPDITFLGWQSWQWLEFLILLPLAFLAALVPTWFVGFLLRRQETEMKRRMGQFITSVVRIILWLLLIRAGVQIIGPSVTMRAIMNVGTLTTIAFIWAAMRFMDLGFDWWTSRLRKSGQESTIVLLNPTKTVFKTVIVIIGIVVWLDNIGYDVATLLAGLGVGGIAVALAAQDTLKNFLGSIMVLLDKPYQVGQRVVVKGHDGVVEKIGLRSTKIRLLTGHQTTVPNEQMAGSDIENIGRRPHIRRLTNITLPYNTPLDKVQKAVDIIRTALDNHEGMDPEFPPRVYFNEFNPASLNILVLYWYHPPNYWDFLDFNQRVNIQIMQEFEKEGIKFAFPTTTTHLAPDDQNPLLVSLTGSSQEPGQTP